MKRSSSGKTLYLTASIQNLSQFPQLLGIFCCYVVVFAEVFIQLVQLPRIFVEIERTGVFPGEPAMSASSNPAVIVKSTVPKHLEILGVSLLPGIWIIEAIHHADSFDRLLWNAIHHIRFGDSCCF